MLVVPLDHFELFGELFKNRVRIFLLSHLLDAQSEQDAHCADCDPENKVLAAASHVKGFTQLGPPSRRHFSTVRRPLRKSERERPESFRFSGLLPSSISLVGLKWFSA